MPKLSSDRLPKYCRHKQSGQAVVYIEGRDVLLGAYNTAASREKFNQVIAEWIAADRTLPAPANAPTILD